MKVFDVQKIISFVKFEQQMKLLWVVQCVHELELYENILIKF